MIESIEFTNFKALRKTTLPLAPFTLLLGPNGSGKSTVLQAIQFVAQLASGKKLPKSRLSLLSISNEDPNTPVEITVRLRSESCTILAILQWHSQKAPDIRFRNDDGGAVEPDAEKSVRKWLARMQTFALAPSAICQAVTVSSGPLQSNGAGLAAVLDDLKDNHPERWDALLTEMRRWIPEYRYIVFDKPQDGQKSIVLRTKVGDHRVPARELSQGTLVSLALLTLAYLPNPPSLVGLEEIDRGLHPRLLRHLQDALYRLSYPESCGEKRPPVQVIATTHSPYLLDLYRDHPEEVVLAHKEGLEVQMKRLSDIEHFGEILGEAPLSEVWYSGVLGGVSVKP